MSDDETRPTSISDRVVVAPWDTETGLLLERWQLDKDTHSYTCPHRDERHTYGWGDVGGLRPSPEGWVCDDCGYTQSWAWDPRPPMLATPDLATALLGVDGIVIDGNDDGVLVRLDGDGYFNAELQFQEWYQYGLERGFVGPLVCTTHDGVPTTDAEDACFDDGDDHCVFMMRPYADEAERLAVEANHSPSVWRR